MIFHSKDIENILKSTQSSEFGLGVEDAKKRLEKNGKNVLPQKKQESKIVRFLKQFCDIMIIILLVASAISITVAIVEKTYSEMVDGFIILAIVVINAIIGFVQELKAEREMKALLSMSEPEAKVKRNSEIVKVHSSELVVGDVVLLEAGDIVPADMRLFESANLKCNESSLTGESVPVEKDAKLVLNEKIPLADRKNMAYKGSVITIGRGEGVVVATGKDTELGKIATMLNQTQKTDTPLQKNIKLVGKIITIIVLIIATLTFILELALKENGSVIEAFLTAVAISVAAIPESLPAVITIIMSMGVSRLSKMKAIIKRLHAVETLGSTQIICSDKTGTLTQNVMTVTKLFYNQKMSDAKSSNLPTFERLLKIMTLCNDSKRNKKGYVGDPTETALCDFAEKNGLAKSDAEKQYKRVGEIPFDSDRKLMSTINMEDECIFCYTKGAPDIILQKCNKILIDNKEIALTKELIEKVLNANKEMGDKALRVLGFAYKKLNDNEDLKKINEDNLTFVGLVGMIDPPRKEVYEAVKVCKKSKMMPVMITGDHKNTAFAIAHELGICENINEVMLGSELDKLSDEDYKKIIYKIKVYARVSPENKVKIVKTFKDMGKIVAMTGDGVNDAPSLKTADIGVGMGITGTDVTKEVADMIVTDDNFATIIVAVEEGRRIYANIKKTACFLFSANMAEILSLFVATILFPNLTFMLPVQILFVNLITDSLPAIALGLELPEKNIMDKAPRKSKDTIFSNGVGIQIVLMGIIQTIAILVAFAVGYKMFGSNLVATSMAFYTLNLAQLAYLLSMRVNTSVFTNNPFKNKWIWVAIGFGLLVLILMAFTPTGSILGLVEVTLYEWLIILAIVVCVFMLSELIKIILKKQLNK